MSFRSSGTSPAHRHADRGQTEQRVWRKRDVTHLFQTDLAVINYIGTVSLEEDVPFVFEHKGYICRNVLRGLVPLFREGDLGPFLPALLDDNVEDLVLCPHASPIWVQPAAGDLHALGTAVEDLFQRDLQLVDHRGVLLLPPCAEAL